MKLAVLNAMPIVASPIMIASTMPPMIVPATLFNGFIGRFSLDILLIDYSPS
jgi:hypothetical protein